MIDNTCHDVTRYYDDNKPGNGLEAKEPLKSGQPNLEIAARQALWIIDHNPPAFKNALEEYAPITWAEMMRDLLAFEAAHR